MSYDYLIAGGGLQAGLLVLALRDARPDATIAVVERGPALGGNHTWSFYETDVSAADAALVAPLVTASWPAYRVAFPGFARTVPVGYRAVTSGPFHAVISSQIEQSGGRAYLDSAVAAVAESGVTLADGQHVAGRCVIDARGVAPRYARAGRQQFVGWEVELPTPWPDALPTIMDATVSQADCYRFLYVLPLTPTRVLFEDTTFTSATAFDPEPFRARLHDYLRRHGVTEFRIVREESGDLPMPYAGHAFADTLPVTLGAAGGWFHPATGYSFPLALAVARAVAAVPPDGMRAAIQNLARPLWWRFRFAQFLNRLLFCVVKPGGRWRVFARLYRALPDERLARFYAMRFTPADAAAMVVGRPPPLDYRRLFLPPQVAPCPPQPS